MLIDSVVIRLERNGVNVSPNYTITIYGNGTLEYNGYNNVSTKGRVVEEFDKEKIILLLSKFKDLGFFSISDYNVDEFAGRSYTVISISIPSNDEQMKIKKIKHYDDENVPERLIRLEDQIDTITNSNKWIFKQEKEEPPEPKEEEKEGKIEEKKVEEDKTVSRIEDSKRFLDRVKRER